jgi:formylglycine-generating enzyme required for sulfatase activity
LADRARDLETAGPEGGGFDPTASAGLFVGISTFGDDRILDVPYAVDDAVDLAHLFAIELGLVAPERVALLLAGEPKKHESAKRLEELSLRGARRAGARQSEIYRSLGVLASNVRPGGLALLSIASHGVSDLGGDFLVAADSLADRKLRTGVAVAELFEEAARAGRGLVLLDACREQVLRSRGAGEGTSGAMGKGFAEAIQRAQGLVVLAGATLGGFAYDDPKRRNGVFTAAVLDGLHGGAAAGPGGWITVRTLADFVQSQVVAWIRKEWPREELRSRGIGRRIEASAENLPLAPHPSATRERQRYHERRQAALGRVREFQGDVLSGAHWDRVRRLLPAEEPNAVAEALLDEIEALDGSVRSQRGLRDYLREGAGQGGRRDDKKKFRWEKSNLVRAAAVAVGIVVLWGIWVVVSKHGEGKTLARKSAPIPANPKAGDPWEGPLGMRFRYVPSGTYNLGSPKGETGRFDAVELLPYKATLTHGVWLGETEVTQEQWLQLVLEKPWRFKQCGPNCPVENLTWYAAAEFANRLSDKEGFARCYQLTECKGTLGDDYDCKALPRSSDCQGYRLPTEAEWEVAARAGTSEATYAGKLTILGADNALVLDAIAWYGGNSEASYEGAFDCSGGKEKQYPAISLCGPQPVGGKRANAWGFHDLLGNVWEWTSDWISGGSHRADRGGSWHSHARFVDDPSARNGILGFRLARGQGLRLRHRPVSAEHSARSEPRQRAFPGNARLQPGVSRSKKAPGLSIPKAPGWSLAFPGKPAALQSLP